MATKDEFFARQTEALTFDDIRLRTRYSDVLPSQVNLETLFSRNVRLKVPITSAAMDTVTEARMAIELAKQGGIGVIHKLLTPEEQAKQVARVKYHLNGLIRTPISFKENDKVKYVLARINEKSYDFRSFPVTDKEGRLVGLLTQTDLDICTDSSRELGQIMTPVRKLKTASATTEIKRAFDLMKRHKRKNLPLIDRDGKLAGMYVLSDIQRVLLGDSQPYNTDENGQLVVAAAVGVRDYERIEKLVYVGVNAIVIDTAHGNSKGVIETVKQTKKRFLVDVVAGNISEADAVKRLADAGADGIKVGQGGGSICTTRIVAGIGTPQVTAVYNCAKAAEEYNIPICSDGGIRNPGDISIAIGAGARSVMLGSLLAGTDESPGDVVHVKGRPCKIYRGMGSLSAMKAFRASRERYGQHNTDVEKLVPEGIESKVPYRGSLNTVLIQYLGGLRAGMGYLGARNIEELRQNADFVKITNAGLKESHPHDVDVEEQ